MRLSSSSKRLVYVVLCLVSLQACASLLLPKSYLLTSITDCVSLVLMISAAVAFGRNSSTSHRRQRNVWIFLSLGYAIESISQMIWMYWELVQKTMPAVSIGDSLVFLAWTSLILGFALRPHIEPTAQQRHIGTLDLVILLLAGVYLYLFLVFPWGYLAVDAPSYGLSYKFLALAEDSILLSIVALGWRNSSGTWRKFYLLLTVIIAIDTVMEYIVDTLAGAGQYFSGGWYDTTSAACLAGMTVAGVLANRLEPEAATDNVETERYLKFASRLAAPVILVLPALAAWSFLDSALPPAVLRFRVLLSLGSMVVFGYVGLQKQGRLEKELADTNRELLDASLTDMLTGVRNRRFFVNSIESDVRQVLDSFTRPGNEEVRNRDLIFYLIDIDHFKQVNDRFGHHVGDKILIEVARRINSAARLSDAVIRWGGEEFLLVSRRTDRIDAHILAKRILDSVGLLPYVIAGIENEIQVSCSLGWAAFPWMKTEPALKTHNQVLTVADYALYHAKGLGRNRAVGLLPDGGESLLYVDGIPASAITVVGPSQPREIAVAASAK